MKVSVNAVLILMISSCTSNSPLQPFDKQGHRGCRGLMPENTIPAMEVALAHGVNTLEMDISFSADSQALLSHEPFFSHDITTKPDGSFVTEDEEKSLNLFKMKYEEIRRYDVGMKPHPRFPKQKKIKVHKPLLSDVIDYVEGYVTDAGTPKIHYNIETKTTPATDNVYHPAPQVFVDLLMKVIDRKKIRNRVIIQSFDIRTLQYLHQKYADVKTSLLIESQELITVNQKIKTLGFDPDIVSPEYHMVTPGMIKDLHHRNIRVIPWTINDASSIERYKALGVDGVITDYPDFFNTDILFGHIGSVWFFCEMVSGLGKVINKISNFLAYDRTFFRRDKYAYYYAHKQCGDCAFHIACFVDLCKKMCHIVPCAGWSGETGRGLKVRGVHLYYIRMYANEHKKNFLYHSIC
jgi:glycerophosphoryl diester phosphodiesterase